MFFYFFNISHVEFLSFVVGLFWADAFNITVTVFWIFFILTALWAIAASMFETLVRNLFAIYQYAHCKTKFYNFVGFFCAHLFFFTIVMHYLMKMVRLLAREANAQFSIFQKNGHVWLTGNDIYESTDIFNTVAYREYLDPEEYVVYRDFLNTKLLWEDVYGDDVKKVESRIVGVKTPEEIADLKKTLTEFYKQTEATFAIYTKRSSYPTNQLDLIKPVGAFSKTEFGLFKSVPWYNYDRGLSEILAGAESLGLGNGWGWDFLIPATSDFVGIIQLYLIIMTVLITVSVMVTFLFKFSATDRLDQVNQLFHRFATSIVRIPEYGVFTLRNGKKSESVYLYDTVENKPEWQVDLDNLQNYQVVPERKLTRSKLSIMRYLTLREFLVENRAEWVNKSEFYDSLRFGRDSRRGSRDVGSVKLPTFLEPTPSFSRSSVENTERGLRFLLKKLREETVFGMLLFTVPKNILVAVLRRLNSKQANTISFVVYKKVSSVFSDMGDILVCSFRSFSRWDYKNYLRFEEKFHYGNQFYKNLTLKNPEPTISNADLNRICKGESLNVRVFTVGAYSNLNTNRIEPPIDDFVYLTNKYMAWAINPVRKTLREAYDLKVKYVDDRVREVTQNLQSNLKWLPSLGIGASYRTLGSTLSMLVSDVDYLVRRFNPNVARSAAVEVELEAVSKGSTFDKKELNKDFWNNYLISSDKLYRKSRPARELINSIIGGVIVPVVDLFYVTSKRLVRYNNKVDAVRGTLPLFKFLTSQSVNKFWVYHSAIEFAWTIIPCLILVFVSVPSFALALALDENFKPQLWVKVIGNQWFWVYEYSTFDEYVVIDSVVQQGSDLKNNALRLLAPDTNVTIPFNKFVRFLVTSTDVIHSWAVPALGVKVDACPGRINSVSILPNRLGIFYGQCSEICGVNHAFMPIAVEIIASPKN